MLKRTPLKNKIKKFDNKSLPEELLLAKNNKNWRKFRDLGLYWFSIYVKIRSNYKCQICGKTGTDAHHCFYTKANNKMTDLMPQNGICLCRNCHIKAHENFNSFKEIILNKCPEYKRYLQKVEIYYNLPIDYEYLYNLILLMYKKSCVENKRYELNMKLKGAF